MAQIFQQPAQSVYPKAHVGFDSITNQIEKKLLKRGFQFNVICVGKSTRRGRRIGSFAGARDGQMCRKRRSSILGVTAWDLVEVAHWLEHMLLNGSGPLNIRETRCRAHDNMNKS